MVEYAIPDFSHLLKIRNLLRKEKDKLDETLITERRLHESIDSCIVHINEFVRNKYIELIKMYGGVILQKGYINLVF